MKYCFSMLVLCFVLIITIPSKAQTDYDDIKEVINSVFIGMEKGDSAKVHSAFAEQVTMAIIYRDKNNAPGIYNASSIDGLLKSVGSPHSEILYEEIWNLKIQIDGDFAQAWGDYAFYTGNKFSHCGLDSFHLYKGKEGWKIFHLAYTVRNEKCDIPAEIKSKHK